MHPTSRVNAAFVSIALGIGLSAVAHSVQAGGRCDSPTVGGEARACAASRDGPEALRRFIQRTRMIYGFSYGDFAATEPAAHAAANMAPSVGTLAADAARVASMRSPR